MTAVPIIVFAAGSAVAAMKIAAATFDIPEDDKPVYVSGLAYPGKWTVEFPMVRLDRDPEPGGDRLVHVWTMFATSTRPMVQKVMIEIEVLDGEGKSLEKVKKYVVVKSMADGQEFPIKMKIEKADWKTAELVRIKVSFMVL